MPERATPKYSIIVPAYNEELRIGAMLNDFLPVFADSELIVVLNGCTDGTQAIVTALAFKWQNLRIVSVESAIGKGGAIRAGFMLAIAPIVAYVDADGATPAVEMRRLCSALAGFDAVIGSRWMRGSSVRLAQPFMRQLASRVFNLCVRALLGLPYHDTQCGAKVFRRDALSEVLGRVETSNLAFDVDLLFALRQHKRLVREVPTVWRDVAGSRVRLVAASSRMLSSLLRLRVRYSMFRYVIPIFDRLLPTRPLPAREQLAILICNWRDPRHPQAGGAETYLFEVGRRWVEMGHHVEWISAGFKGAEANEVLDGISISRVGNRATIYGLLPLTYLRRFRDRFDIIVDSENGIPFFSPLFSLKPKICLMHHVHTSVFRAHLPAAIAELFVWAESWLMPLVYRNVSFIAVSEDTKKEMIRQRFSDRPIHVVYNGVDDRLQPGKRSETPVIAYVGRLKEYKRVHLLIEAMVEIRLSVPGTVLKIAGRGDEEAKLKDLVTRLGLGECVQFAGFVNEPKKKSLLQEAWVFASPSSMEGWGISVIEAGACGTPSVAYDVPGLREAIVDDTSGLLVPADSSLATAITRVLLDEALRDRLACGGIAVAQRYSWEKTAKMLLDRLVATIAGNQSALIRLNGAWSFVELNSATGAHSIVELRDVEFDREMSRST